MSCSYFTCTAEQCYLELRWRRPTDYEIDVIARAPLRIGITVVQRCAFLLYAWERGPYGDAPYLTNGEVGGRQARRPRTMVSELPLTIRLVDAETSRPRVIRHAVLDEPVSTAVRGAAERFAPFSELKHYGRLIESVYRHLTLDQLVATGGWAAPAWPRRNAPEDREGR
jgi:hypothetical protein